jgi:hypothetical protein
MIGPVEPGTKVLRYRCRIENIDLGNTDAADLNACIRIWTYETGEVVVWREVWGTQEEDETVADWPGWSPSAAVGKTVELVEATPANLAVAEAFCANSRRLAILAIEPPKLG